MNKNITLFYNFFKYIFILLYVVSLLGLGDKFLIYLDVVNEIYKVFIAFILIYFFNPWTKTNFEEMHKKIAFQAGILLIFTSSVEGIIKNLPFIRKFRVIKKLLT